MSKDKTTSSAGNATGAGKPPRTSLGTAVIGKPANRVDGLLKVTGNATYSAEFPVPNVCYGAIIQSAITRGTIKQVEAKAAESVPGVLAVFTCENKPMKLSKQAAEKGATMFLLQDNVVRFSGQMIGLVVAETQEAAKHAASLVEFTYKEEKFDTDFLANIDSAVVPEDGRYKRGNVKKALSGADVKVDATYTTPAENHNPMEPFATIAQWEGDNLTLYESTQCIFNSRGTIAAVLQVPEENVRIISPFIGGGFGSKLYVWPHAVLAAMAAKKLGRPVKVVLGRTQMFGPVGFRPMTKQKMILGARRDGTLVATTHEGYSQTARFTTFIEHMCDVTRMCYACPNLDTVQGQVALDTGPPAWMRAPGHATGSFALESAMDELACALNMDPVELRLHNFAETDQQAELPWSSNSLRECYRLGAEQFGWQKRNPKPRSMRDGDLLVGWGMATALHTCWRNPSSARVELHADGRAIVQSGSQDIGTGTYTIMSQIAAEKLALPLERVTFSLGDTNLPPAPTSGGSTTAGSVGNAVSQACVAAITKLIQSAIKDTKSKLHGAKAADVVACDGKLMLKGTASKGETYESVISRLKSRVLDVEIRTDMGDADKHYSFCSFGAVFIEVKVDEDLGTIRVSRANGAYAGGKILNSKTARSQLLGGITFGIGMALMEHTVFDHRFGRIVNSDLAEYAIPVHPDIGKLDIHFVDEHDPHINDVGAKGLGELGITGVPAAIANAIFHATGKRFRNLPITRDHLL